MFLITLYNKKIITKFYDKTIICNYDAFKTPDDQVVKHFEKKYQKSEGPSSDTIDLAKRYDRSRFIKSGSVNFQPIGSW